MLDGASGYVDLGSRTFGGAMSWVFWARVDAYQSWQRLFDWGAGSPMDNLLLSPSPNSPSGMLGGAMGISISVGSNNPNVYTPTVLTLGAWQHHALTLDAAGGVVYYVNGAQVFSAATNAAATTTRTHLYLGKSWWNGDPFFKGALSDFQFALGTVFSAYDVANRQRQLSQVVGALAVVPERAAAVDGRRVRFHGGWEVAGGVQVVALCPPGRAGGHACCHRRAQRRQRQESGGLY